MKTFKVIIALAALAAGAPETLAEGARRVFEPGKITNPAKLKDGEGALRMSVRAQVQTIDTLFVYFVEVRDDGSDGTNILRFERGAGVPILGSNMIDPKPQVYRVPAGRYRPLGFTIKCQGVPFAGAVCTSGFGGTTPTGHYGASPTLLVVEPGKLSDAGDFVVEYAGTITDPRANVFEERKGPTNFALRRRPTSTAAATATAFDSLPRTPLPEVPEDFRSRITCESRPAGTLLYIPFAC